jgi:hypothetical protein
VNQRVCEWHSGFGAAALAVVNAFFKADANDFRSDDDCKNFAKSLLDEFTFLFGSVKETKKKVGQTEFPLQVTDLSHQR